MGIFTNNVDLFCILFSAYWDRFNTEERKALKPVLVIRLIESNLDSTR